VNGDPIGGSGCFLYTRAGYLYYYFVHERELQPLLLSAARDRFRQNRRRFGLVRQTGVPGVRVAVFRRNCSLGAVLVREDAMQSERWQALKKMLQDEDPQVREAAAQALERLETLLSVEEVIAAMGEGPRGRRIQAIFAAEQIDSVKVLPALLAQLEDPDEDIRVAAVQVLGRKKHPKTLGELVKRLKDPSPSVRFYAAEALGEFGDKRLVPYLAQLLKGRDLNLACCAAMALGRIAAGEAQPALMAALGDERPELRAAAARALGMLRL